MVWQEQAWRGEKPDVSHLSEFGSISLIHVPD